MSEAAFYCVADERYFLGAVGLVNSLRLVGHEEPIHLLDCGLTAEQRELLAGEVELVDAPADAPPWLLKTAAPMRRGAQVTVLIDSDMIATRSLEPLIEQARHGRVVAFEDRQDRWFANWGALLDLDPAVRGPYVSSGLAFLGGAPGAKALELLDDRQRRVDFERTFWRRNDRSYPFRFADQDVLNAILAASRETIPLDALAERLAATPPFRGLKITDAGRLLCEYSDGSEPFVVHQYVRKPWLETTYDGIYSRLLRRLLTGDGIALRPPEAWLPLRLRRGALAGVERARGNVADYARWHLGHRLPAPIATRIEHLRRLGTARSR